jgi:glycosyltransferase involved in cell wall biosynthesis
VTGPAQEGAPSPSPLPVTLVMRHPVAGWHSIETVFSTVSDHLPPDIRARLHVAPRRSAGIAARIVNLVDLIRLRRLPGVFHITGDVHYLALALPRRRTVLTIHDLGTLKGSSRLRRSVIALLWFHLPVRLVSRVTVISAATRDELIELIPTCADRVELIPNPLPADLHPRRSVPPDGRPTVLVVGTTPNKNLPRVIEAVAPLDVRLVIVGVVPDAAVGPLSRAGNSGGAVLETHVDLARDELVALYARADVVVLASTSEGFGLPVIESQAMGVPVVASRIPALVEVAGDAARLVDPTDVADIRGGITDVLEDARLRERLVAAGLSNVRRFEAARIAESYADVYRSIATAAESDPAR